MLLIELLCCGVICYSIPNASLNETVHLIGAYNDLYFDFIKCGSSIALYVFGFSFSRASKSSSALVIGPFPYGLKTGIESVRSTVIPENGRSLEDRWSTKVVDRQKMTIPKNWAFVN